MYSDTSKELIDDVVAEFLEGAPTADVWKSLRITLEDRFQQLHQEFLDADEDDKLSFKKQLEALEQQIAALAQEEAITRFVEDSVRATLAQTEFPKQ